MNVAAGLLKVFRTALVAPCVNTAGVNLQSVRHRVNNKHWNPKFKRLRKLKVFKVKLPDFNENPEDFSEEEVRSRMKERGMLPSRPWVERPIFIGCTGGVVEPYVPPEGDGKVSRISKTGAKQTVERVEKKSKTVMAIRKIRNYDEEFNRHEFGDAAQDIYIKVHTLLTSMDKEKLREFVTEKAYPEICDNCGNKTVHWKFVKSLEPPKIVHARVEEIISKDNVFAQLTVRFFTQQILAIYDRFGRLMHGSEILAKDVLEYVVFERHLSNLYGQWRLHDKIIPDWMPPRDPILNTFRVQEIPVDSEPSEVPLSENKDKPSDKVNV